MRLPAAPCKHWKIAECSESTGKIGTPFSRAARMTICPAHTSVSLLASAIAFPASMAAIVGSRPTIPTTAVTTTSASGRVAASIKPSIPETTRISVSASFVFSSFAFSSLYTATKDGCKARACSSARAILVLTEIAHTCASMESRISMVCVPIEPVEPRITIFFMSYNPRLENRCSSSSTSGATKITLSNRSSTPP